FSPHSTMYRPFTDADFFPMSQSLHVNSQVPPSFQSMVTPHQMMQPPQPVHEVNNDYQSYMASMFPEPQQASPPLQSLLSPSQIFPFSHQSALMPQISPPSLFRSAPTLISPPPPLLHISSDYSNPISLPPSHPHPAISPIVPVAAINNDDLAFSDDSAYTTPSSSPEPHLFEMSHLNFTPKASNSYQADDVNDSSQTELMPQSVRCFIPFIFPIAYITCYRSPVYSHKSRFNYRPLSFQSSIPSFL
ncbi:hypothetical protein PENTCL1PPCAC_10152, partial [Pristionchus entomophagus]